MKCSKCGKEANVYYRSNVNGKVTTMNLCDECAKKLNDETGFMNMDHMFDQFDNMFGSMFGGMSNLLSPMFANPWANFGFNMPSLMPKYRIMLEPVTENEQRPTEKAETVQETAHEVDPEMRKRRELNALREQMNEAVKNEEFEKAAELRDKIRGLQA
jgi:protein arginine kinase activator